MPPKTVVKNDPTTDNSTYCKNKKSRQKTGLFSSQDYDTHERKIRLKSGKTTQNPTTTNRKELRCQIKCLHYTIDWIARGIQQDNEKQHQHTSTLAAAYSILNNPKKQLHKNAPKQMTLGL